jgi:hypothetical protein
MGYFSDPRAMVPGFCSQILNLSNQLTNDLSHRCHSLRLSFLQSLLAIARFPQHFYILLHITNFLFVPQSLDRHRRFQDWKFSHFLIQLRQLMFQIRHVLIHFRAAVQELHPQTRNLPPYLHQLV